MKKQITLHLLCALLIIILAIHLIRIALGWTVEINGITIPLIVSYLAVVILAYLTYSLYRLSR